VVLVKFVFISGSVPRFLEAKQVWDPCDLEEERIRIEDKDREVSVIKCSV
jgi:hypothetical protein